MTWSMIVSLIFLIWLFGTAALLWLIWQNNVTRTTKMEDALTHALDIMMQENQRLSQKLRESGHEAR